jgi:hypothetical protein
MLVEALADSETLNEPEIDWLVEIETLVLCDSETEALVLDDSLSDIDSLVETEALNEAETEVETD